jgi:hypothetical protein
MVLFLCSFFGSSRIAEASETQRFRFVFAELSAKQTAELRAADMHETFGSADVF